MLAWLTKRLTRSPDSQAHSPDRQAGFRQALAHYPAHVPPHRGWGKQLTLEQAQQNLDWFRQTIPERLAALRALAADTGLALGEAPVSSLDEARHLVVQLIGWTRACWPDAPYRTEHKSYDDWAASDRTGDDAIFSVVLDVATLLGETIRAGRSEWRWGLDMARASLGHQPMLSARRVVLLSPLLGPQQVVTHMDLELLVLDRYLKPHDLDFTGPPEQDAWMQYVCDGYTGQSMDLLAEKSPSAPAG